MYDKIEIKTKKKTFIQKQLYAKNCIYQLK